MIEKFRKDVLESSMANREDMQQFDEIMQVAEHEFKKLQGEPGESQEQDLFFFDFAHLEQEEGVGKELEPSMKHLRDFHKVMVEQCAKFQDFVGEIKKMVEAEVGPSADLKQQLPSI